MIIELINKINNIFNLIIYNISSCIRVRIGSVRIVAE